MKKVIFGIFLVLLLATSYATDDKLNEAVEGYNSQIANSPGFVQNYLGTENIHLYLTDGTTDEYAAKTVQGKITEIEVWTDVDGDGKHDPWFVQGIKATMRVTVDMDTIQKIANSDDATFNIVGKNSIKAALKAQIISENGIIKIQNIPHALGLL